MLHRSSYEVVEVVVDHDRRVLHVSEAFTGVAHDQSVMENDPFPRDIAYGKLYVNTEPKVVFVKKEEGNYQQFWEGVYFLSDQGYQKIRAFIDPTTPCFNHTERLFTEWIEAVRKNVECFFGILKSRYRLLKNAVRYHDIKVINDAFRTCCVVHNMIIQYNLDPNADWNCINCVDDLSKQQEQAVEEEEQEEKKMMEIKLTMDSSEMRMMTTMILMTMMMMRN